MIICATRQEKDVLGAIQMVADGVTFLGGSCGPAKFDDIMVILKSVFDVDYWSREAAHMEAVLAVMLLIDTGKIVAVDTGDQDGYIPKWAVGLG
tara:strand:+ start:13149 stop:13430 length:282 start_codon:yes stop_codon:yes gene_type:complete